ncbi:alpha/beta hydrolase [Parafrigoribacterium mesophilum]|uniref:alpha/beta hydrolase n=1 Tax=Parafrigoribacterium mesophilum TaxID=433646 RepID=UPI0031FCB226
MIDTVEVVRDVTYAGQGASALAMDLYLPRGADVPPPIAVYFHGGGWARGTRGDLAQERLVPLARRGVAVASVSYRLIDVALWPAQLYDAKGAVRWLRANAARFGIDGSRIGAWGASAGGHLAALLGLTAGLSELEGDVGGNLDRDSSVSCVVAWFPPTDLIALTEQPADPAVPLPSFLAGRPVDATPAQARLLGVHDVHEAPDAARAASPISYAHRAGPPFRLVHGDRDGLIPHYQSRILHDALLESGSRSTLLLVAGANHEDEAFQHPSIIAATAELLRGSDPRSR